MIELPVGVRADKQLFNVGEVLSLIRMQNYVLINTERMRYDVLERAFDSKKNVFYVEHFPISQIYSGEQGWEADQVRELMNRLLVAYHLTPVNHLSEFNSVVSKKLFEDAHDFTPPIIATVLPDNHVDLLDGNHRVALFQIFLRLPTIRAFIIV